MVSYFIHDNYWNYCKYSKQEVSNGFLPVSIAKEDRLSYYNELEEYAVSGNLDVFLDLIADLEEKQLDSYIKLIRE